MKMAHLDENGPCTGNVENRFVSHKNVAKPSNGLLTREIANGILPHNSFYDAALASEQRRKVVLRDKKRSLTKNEVRTEVARASATGGDTSLQRIFDEVLANAGGTAVGKRELLRRLGMANNAVRDSKALKFQIDFQHSVLESAGPLFREFGIPLDESRKIAVQNNWQVDKIRAHMAERFAVSDDREIATVQPMVIDQRGSMVALMAKRHGV